MSNVTASEITQGEKVRQLLESLESGDHAPIAFINPQKYVQHNLAVGDGLEGFGAVVANAPPQGFKANVWRVFEDGNYAVAHTEYDFFGPQAGFDVFRFENGQIVEHWDNLQPIAAPNPSGRTQFDGPTEIQSLEKTEENKALVASFVDRVLFGGDFASAEDFVHPERYHQHNPAIGDGLDGLGAALEAMAAQGVTMKYDTRHLLLGQGNFVLTACEGEFAGKPSAFFDLFRVEDGRIVEHWDTIQEIPPRDQWKNDNGKF
ncbi:MAG: nuclear transport factor 2 family protein [Acidobacteriota bacterium]